MRKILIINGPNLNLLGRRNPEIYGSESFEETLAMVKGAIAKEDADADYYQSNSEGDIIDRLQEAGFSGEYSGIVLNPGAYAHYSIAIADAIYAIPVPVVEVHISNIHAREEFRHKSVTARAAKAVIAGAGRYGYILAALYLITNSR